MRVLHVVEVTHGGVVTLVRAFALDQAHRGLDVHVLARPDVDGLAGQVHRWDPVRRRPGSLISAVRDLHQVVAATEPDVVHLHSFFPGVLGRVRRWPGSPRVVYQPHSWAFQAAPWPGLEHLVARWERAAARRTDLTITNCRQELDEAREHKVEGAMSVVGLPVDTDHFRPGDKATAREALGVAADRTIVCVGRLSRQKGQRDLALAWASSPLPATELVFVGPGDPDTVTDVLPSDLRATVRMVGPTQDVRPWLHAADLVVLPSRYEGQSVAMAEALACGVPVVMTDVNGAQEAVAPRGQPPAGAVVPPGDMKELLRQCEDRLHDPTRLVAEGQVARERATALFDAAGIMERVLQAYSHNGAADTPRAG